MSSRVGSLLRIARVAAVATAGLGLACTNSLAQVACQSLTPAAAVDKANELFKRWNDLLGNNGDIVGRYAERSILLPTVSNEPRLSREEKQEYFKHFRERKPSGQLSPVGRTVFFDCNTLVDAGLYTFFYPKTEPGVERTRARYSYTYQFDGTKNDWFITSHHSSKMPETELSCQIPIPSQSGNAEAQRTCPKACQSAIGTSWSWAEWSGQWTNRPTGDAVCGCFMTVKGDGSGSGCSPIANN